VSAIFCDTHDLSEATAHLGGEGQRVLVVCVSTKMHGPRNPAGHVAAAGRPGLSLASGLRKITCPAAASACRA
jgi:hypothetical protein